MLDQIKQIHFIYSTLGWWKICHESLRLAGHSFLFSVNLIFLHLTFVCMINCMCRADIKLFREICSQFCYRSDKKNYTKEITKANLMQIIHLYIYWAYIVFVYVFVRLFHLRGNWPGNPITFLQSWEMWPFQLTTSVLSWPQWGGATNPLDRSIWTSSWELRW